MTSIDLSVIIPTTASSERGALLRRAIKSVVDEGALPIVVVNGSRFDPRLRQDLAATASIKCLYREEGSLPGALLEGRNSVTTEFFAVLDDDDEFMPGAFKARLRPFRQDSNIDVVVTGGYRRRDGQLSLYHDDIEVFQKDPLQGLMDFNWLASAAGTYRTERVQSKFFEHLPRYLEWTCLAVRLALERNIKLIKEPTYICSADSPGSLSKSKEYIVCQPVAVARMLDAPVPPAIRRQLRKKYAAALHVVATLMLRDGNRACAWRYHLKSLRHGGLLRYALFTRHLLC